MKFENIIKGSFLVALLISPLAMSAYTTSGVTYTVDPDPAVEQTTISGPITLTFQDCATVSGMKEGGETMDIYAHFTGSDFAIIGETSANKLIFTPNSPAIVKGKYTLSIEDSFLVTKNDGSQVTVSPFGISFNVTGNGELEKVEIDPEISPAAGDVKELGEFEILFKGATIVTSKENPKPSDYPKLYLMQDGERTSTTYGTWMPSCSANKLSFKLYSTLSVPGNYQLVIPKQFLKVNGYDLEEDLTFDYTILVPEIEIPYTCTIDPADGTEFVTFSGISVCFSSEAEGVTFERQTYGSLFPSFYYVNGDNEERVAGRISGDSKGNPLSFSWTPGYELDQEGSYRFIIPSDYITVTDSEGNAIHLEEMTVDYLYKTSSSAISRLLGERGEADVFTIDGKCIGKSLSVEAIKALPAGIYVINGKKSILR